MEDTEKIDFYGVTDGKYYVKIREGSAVTDTTGHKYRIYFEIVITDPRSLYSVLTTSQVIKSDDKGLWKRLREYLYDAKSDETKYTYMNVDKSSLLLLKPYPSILSAHLMVTTLVGNFIKDNDITYESVVGVI